MQNPSSGANFIRNSPKLRIFHIGPVFLCVVDGHEKTDFSLQLFWLWLIFDLFSDLMDQNMPGAKEVVIMKNQQRNF